MFLRVGEIAIICLVGILLIALPTFLMFMVAKLNKRLRELEEKLKEK